MNPTSGGADTSSVSIAGAQSSIVVWDMNKETMNYDYSKFYITSTVNKLATSLGYNHEYMPNSDIGNVYLIPYSTDTDEEQISGERWRGAPPYPRIQ